MTFFERLFMNQEKIKSELEKKDNSLLNQIYPKKQPGIYMIRCIQNDWRYYGESSNISSRLASHRSMLNRKIHPNRCFQNDWDFYGPNNFEFVVLYMGKTWEDAIIRRGKETELIVLDRSLCYNILETISKPGEKNPFWGRIHTKQAKDKISQALKGRPNILLGKKISIKGTIYPSIAEASRQTGIARKTIRKKIDDPNAKDYFEIDNLGNV
jgi:hypothetical protein